jgi:hypothetical protein
MLSPAPETSESSQRAVRDRAVRDRAMGTIREQSEAAVEMSETQQCEEQSETAV